MLEVNLNFNCWYFTVKYLIHLPLYILIVKLTDSFTLFWRDNDQELSFVTCFDIHWILDIHFLIVLDRSSDLDYTVKVSNLNPKNSLTEVVEYLNLPHSTRKDAEQLHSTLFCYISFSRKSLWLFLGSYLSVKFI